jgi:cytochrome c-type biogenesis protein CcmH/NrfG
MMIEKAIAYFKRVLAIQESDGETWASIGHCYLMTENLQDAYQAYQQALYLLNNPKVNAIESWNIFIFTNNNN